MSRRNEDIVRFEKKATNHLGLFFVIIFALALLGGGGFLVYKYRDQIDWELKLPWEYIEENEEKKENNKKPSKNNHKLVIPKLPKKKIEKGSCTFAITNIKADDKGYLMTGKLTTNSEGATMNVEQVVIDGYYTPTSFSVTASKSEPDGGVVEFRIDKTELDKYNVKGFNRLTFFYDLVDVSGDNYENTYSILNFSNPTELGKGIKGQLKVDEYDQILIEYYKTEVYPDATYIYFQAKNKDHKAARNLSIKKLLVNDRIYEMPEYEETLYKGCYRLFSIKIPRKKIKDVENFTISFFITNEDKDGVYTDIYVTNDYYKEV